MLLPLALLTAAMGANAQSAATVAPPPHPLGAVTVRSTTIFRNIAEVRQLSDGRVLVHDPTARTITLLDASLGKAVVVLDSAGGRNNSYGSQRGKLLPFHGDSTLFFDGESTTLLVLDPAGKVARVMASVPSPSDAEVLGPMPPSMLGSPSFAQLVNAAAVQVGMSMVYSPALGLMHLHVGGMAMVMPTRFGARVPREPGVMVRLDDSLAVIAMNPATRGIDTLGSILIGVAQLSAGTAPVMDIPGPFPIVDDWTVTADGSLAILRTREYRIDWVNPDRTHTAGPRLPYPWHSLSDGEKLHVVDSVNSDRAKAYAERVAAWTKDSVAAAQGKPIATASGRLPAKPRSTKPTEVADVPDFIPSLATWAEALLGDADNNLWILSLAANPTPGASMVYDIVNRSSQIVDRVIIPDGRRVIGFGPNGMVYLIVHDGGNVWLERARVR